MNKMPTPSGAYEMALKEKREKHELRLALAAKDAEIARLNAELAKLIDQRIAA